MVETELQAKAGVVADLSAQLEAEKAAAMVRIRELGLSVDELHTQLDTAANTRDALETQRLPHQASACGRV